MLKKIMLVFLGFGILVASQKMFVFMFVSLAPAFVAYIIDRSVGKSVSTTVGLFNFSGFAIFSVEMLQGSGSLRNLSDALDPFKLMVVYLFAAVGWFIVWIVPKVTTVIFEYKDSSRAVVIQKKLIKIEEEWSIDIRS